MDLALGEAEAAGLSGEVPIGAVVVGVGGEVLARAGNRTLQLRDPTAHAELIAIREACAKLGSERLTGCDLHVTLEPCAMCAAAIVHARVARLVFGAWDPRVGAAGSVLNLVNAPVFNHRVDTFGGVLAEECGTLLRRFFERKRA